MELKRSPHLSFVILIWTCVVVDEVNGYAYGAPNDRTACNTLLPSHEVVAQTNEMPYDVFIDGAPNKDNYDPTKNHTVTISGKSGTLFKGFILQARKYTSGSNFVTMGSFSTSSDVIATCQTIGGGTATQKSNTTKTSLTMQWISPPNATGVVEFRGSIVLEYYVFWEFLPQLSPPSTAPPNTTGEIPPEPTKESPVAINTTDCGTTKGCFLSNCPDPNNANQCEYGVTWSAAGPTGTAFELFASATFHPTPYVALGLSKDTKMGDDSVTDCVYDQGSGSVVVQMSWNDGETNDVLADKTLSLVNGSTSGSFNNGMLICRFARLTYPPPTNTTSQDQIFYPGTELYHILIAKGVSSSGYKAEHTVDPVESAEKFDFTLFVSSSAQLGLSPLIKAHGIMMIFGWMVFASFGIIMPRYYKTAWPGKTWGGKAIWFQLHQPLMVITLILTAVAFTLIFVEEGGYSQLESPADAHPPLGIIVMALVLINPIMAVFRPDPKSDKRWLFNILHFLVGLLAHLSAAVALLLATYIEKMHFPEWCRWVMVFYICWHAAIEIILAVHMHLTLRKKSSKKDISRPSSQDPLYEEKVSTMDSYSLFRTTLCVLHLVGVLGCSIALSVQIGIS